MNIDVDCSMYYRTTRNCGTKRRNSWSEGSFKANEKVSDNDSQERLIAARSAKCDNGSFCRFPDFVLCHDDFEKKMMEIINLCIEGLTRFDIITTITICTLLCHAICDFFWRECKKIKSTIFFVITLRNNEESKPIMKLKQSFDFLHHLVN